MLRTHHYQDATFLSIYEEMAQITTNVDGVAAVVQAINIEPGFAFNLANSTSKPNLITRIRAVLEYSPSDNYPTNFKESYFVVYEGSTAETCISSVQTPVTPPTYNYLGLQTVRNIPNLPVYEYESQGQTIQQTYIQEPIQQFNSDPVTNGMATFIFRTNLTYPAGGHEIGYLLDQGNHFNVINFPDWFSTAGCSTGRLGAESDLVARLRSWFHPLMPIQPNYR